MSERQRQIGEFVGWDLGVDPTIGLWMRMKVKFGHLGAPLVQQAGVLTIERAEQLIAELSKAVQAVKTQPKPAAN
jgi:hypothetical protein